MLYLIVLVDKDERTILTEDHVENDCFFFVYLPVSNDNQFEICNHFVVLDLQSFRRP